ncbi:MAG TPA: SDR family oxidoreductase [Thermoanaerobaculia bacterium]|nr:SDR family oxidoreductase [Thermoanaerobaculia bacterium]
MSTEPALTTPPPRPVALVTGAAAGIGRAVALRFAEGGWDVAAWDVSPRLADLEADLLARGAKAHLTLVDVSDSAAVAVALEGVRACFGRLRAVVANAGVVRDGLLVKWRGGQAVSQLSDEDFDLVVDTNLRGVFLTVRAAVPLLIASGGGSVAVASSVVAATGNFGQTNYAAAKAGLEAMVKTWARELGRYRIRVNAVAPGFVATPMVDALPELVVKRVVEHTPLGRLGRPEEVAEAYFWLASEAASFVSGAVLPVDGGLIIGS